MTVLIVPSAKLVGLDLQLEYGPIPPVLVPLGGRVALRSIVDFYRNAVSRIFILVDEGGDLVSQYLDFFPDPCVELVRVRSGDSLASSIEDLIRQRPELMATEAIISLGDTLSADLDLSLAGSDFIVWGRTEETGRWTLFRTGPDGGLTISDKAYQYDGTGWKTFVGVWGFRDFGHFLSLLAGAPAHDTVGRFHLAVGRYARERGSAFVESADWVDYGHLDNLNAARRRAMNLRHFNTMSFGHGGATVRKTSRNSAKFLDEIRWMTSQPEDLRVFLPAIYSHSTDPDEPHLEMEFYSYPSLDECFVYARHDFDTWERVFARIFEVLSLQNAHRVEAPDLRRDLTDMYVTKTTERVRAFLDQADIAADRPLTINGIACPSLEEVLATLPGLLDRHGALSADAFGISHGDLCFGNILFEARHNLMKLVDPRGRFGRHTLHGDVHYDLAKLSHSALGLYDFIIFNQFRVRALAPDAFEFHVRARDYHQTISRIFTKHVRANGYDLARIRLIESILFLSMLPLHRTNPDHQRAMLCRGLLLFAEVSR